MESVVIRRIRAELPEEPTASQMQELIAFPYNEWIVKHIEELMTLQYNDAEPVVSGVVSRCMGNIFVTDIFFRSQTHLAFYNEHYLITMRSRVIEAYPSSADQASPFKYTVTMSTDPMTFESIGYLSSFDVVASVGCVCPTY